MQKISNIYYYDIGKREESILNGLSPDHNTAPAPYLAHTYLHWSWRGSYSRPAAWRGSYSRPAAWRIIKSPLMISKVWISSC